jgi:hypothetical protein
MRARIAAVMSPLQPEKLAPAASVRQIGKCSPGSLDYHI